MAWYGRRGVPVRSAVVDLPSQPVRNLWRNPGVKGSDPGAYLSSWQGVSPNATYPSGWVTASWALSDIAWRTIWAIRSHASGDAGFTLSVGHPALPQIVGRRATFVFDLVCPVGGWSLPTGFMVVGNVSYPGTTTANGTIYASAPGQVVTAGVPVRCWATFSVPATTTAITSLRANLATMPLVAGIYVDYSNFDLYLGDYDPKRLPGNGDLPGWQWAGAAWASESVGYPYSLESIAGALLGSNLTATATAGQNAFVGVPDLPPLQGRTLYNVYDVIDTSTAYVSPVLYRETSSSTATYGRVAFQSGAASVDAFGSRVDLAGGSSNATLTRTNQGVRAVGRHVASIALNDGLTAQTVRMDNLSTTTFPLTPGSGLAFPAGTAQLAHLATPSTPPIASYLYAGEHNEQTARRVMAWLVAAYGTDIVPPALLDAGTQATTVWDVSYDAGTEVTSTGYTFDGGSA